MEVRIGIVQSMKEIDVELAPDAERREGHEGGRAGPGRRRGAVADGPRGRRVGVPASRVAYVEVASVVGRAGRRFRRLPSSAVIDYHLHLWPHSESSVWFQLDQIAAYCEEAARHGRHRGGAHRAHQPFSRRHGPRRPVLGRARPRADESRAMAEYFDFHARNSLEEYVDLAATGQGRGPAGQDRPGGRLLRRPDGRRLATTRAVPLRRAHRLGPLAGHVDSSTTTTSRARCTSGPSATSTQCWADYTRAIEELCASQRRRRARPPRPHQGRRATSPRDRGDYWDLMADASAAADVSMECSSAGWTKPVAEQYPSEGFLDRLVARGVTFTTASDAHELERVGRARRRPGRPARGARRARGRDLRRPPASRWCRCGRA